jgi:hypothetical protein
MEATCSSETSFDFQQTILRYTPEDRTIQHYNLVHFSQDFEQEKEYQSFWTQRNQIWYLTSE